MPSNKRNTRKLKKNFKKNKKMKSLKKGGMWPFDKDDKSNDTSFSILDFFKSKTPEQKIEEIKKKKEKCIEKADKEIEEIQNKSKETIEKPPLTIPPVPPSSLPSSTPSSPLSSTPSSLLSSPPSSLPSESEFQKKGGRRRIRKRTYRKK